MTPATQAFLGRLTRLDRAALVRVRGGELWARVPWDVLVTSAADGAYADRVVRAAAWLDLGVDDPAELPNLDDQWRFGLPPASGVVVETMPAQVFRRIGDAAAATLRETSAHGLAGRAVGERVIRDALLDHVPIHVTPDDADIGEIRVPQRLVQAVVRMGLLGPDDYPTDVVSAGPWVGIRTNHSAAWWRANAMIGLRPYRA
jgi:hypothetical protein